MVTAIQQVAVTTRALISDITGEVAGLREVAGEIAAGNQDLSSRTEAQASSLEQTAASMEEITGTVKSTVSSVDDGARCAETANLAARASSEAVGKMAQTMAQISESSRRISEFNPVIEQVAFQTNILALNAAVEAARPATRAGVLRWWPAKSACRRDAHRRPRARSSG